MYSVAGFLFFIAVMTVTYASFMPYEVTEEVDERPIEPVISSNSAQSSNPRNPLIKILRRRVAPFIPESVPNVPIESQSFHLSPDKSYIFKYKSGDGSARCEKGAPFGLGVKGCYTYIDSNGEKVVVKYVADEYGFRPSSSIIHPQIEKAVAEQVAFAKSISQPIFVPPIL